ncbi:MAG TPA: pilus assembly protein TadG-related protein [Acidimicrobiales bacterium]|nr:pilus assembly protein TadG-related protein [Acidimicrobiales bacterium]
MRRSLFLNRARRDQRGVVLVLAVPALVLALASMALSVDIGRQVLEKRDLQKIADLAALDAARDVDNAQTAAEASADRNGFDPTEEGASLVAERGAIDSSRAFTVDPAGDSVRVTLTARIDYIFAPGSRSVTATAVGQREAPTPPPTTPTTTTSTATPVPTAGFTIGSTLASVDTTKASLLNKVLGAWMKGTASGGGTADVVGWQGLVDARITLADLQSQLELLESGVQFGTVDELLAADLKLADLAKATANALNAAGEPSQAALYAGPLGITAQATSTATFQLDDLITVAAGSGDAALATELNAWELLVGSAMVANGTNLVSIPDIGISIPGLGTTSLSLKVIEAKRTYIGPAGSGVSTAQVEMTITPTLDRPLVVTGLTDARLVGSFPFTLQSAGATGTLSAITCSGTSPGIGVTTDLKAFSASTSATLGVNATVLLASVPVATVATSGGVALTDPTSENVEFAYPGQFTPSSTGKRVGSSPLGLSTGSSFDATVTSLGVVALAADLDVTIENDLKEVAGLLDEHMMAHLHKNLGVSIGVADLAALKKDFDYGCANPIVPTTTATTTVTTTGPTTTTTMAPPKLVG